MPGRPHRRLKAVPPGNVTIGDRFWAPRLETNRSSTIPAEYEKLKETGRIDAWRLGWRPGDPDPPHIFWDSDVAKWVEAASCSLATHPDPGLEKLVDEVVDLIEAAQRPDGYLNVHFTVVEPERRWTNLRDRHELYCAGHLMEAAVAHFEATGKRKLLDVLRRYADHIDSVFGPEAGKRRGYPGHEEIELALVRLYRATGEGRYLRLAKFFVDARGWQPNYFTIEARARGDDPARLAHGGYSYNQSHRPVREQDTAEGHAVRACYLYAGVADVAAETGDEYLARACRRIWQNIVTRRMYVTGGVGSARHGERFTTDYDLPNETAYAETCAQIALVFFAQRMLHMEADARYADVMERALYNGVASGVSLDGRAFFYANPLAAFPGVNPMNPTRAEPGPYRRSEWFGCACCPPNIARLLASLGGYVYSQGEEEVYVNLYVQGGAEIDLDGRRLKLTQKTDYPWGEKVVVSVAPESPSEFTLALRIPGWCRLRARAGPSAVGGRGGAKLKVNGENVALAKALEKGYARIARRWKKGDRVELALPMPVERVEAHPSVRFDAGRVALQRGPVVYCLEEADNGPCLDDISLPRASKLQVRFEKGLLGGVPVMTGKAKRRDASGRGDELGQNRSPAALSKPLGPSGLASLSLQGGLGGASAPDGSTGRVGRLRRSRTVMGDELYRRAVSKTKPVTIKAVPYCTWANRAPGEMTVWIREC